MQRTLLPEYLDKLAHDHRDAMHSRRDLRLFNSIMGNPSWITGMLKKHLRRGERVLELGAGCGTLSTSLRRAGIRTDALDLCPSPSNWPKDQTWFQTDVFAFQDWHKYPVIVANLFLHHFERDALHYFGSQLSANTRLFITCEPIRKKHYQKLFSACCHLIRANYISRYDGHVSIAAGFIQNELPLSLNLSASWHWKIQQNLRGAYRMIAFNTQLHDTR